jgi:hypothetical protein
MKITLALLLGFFLSGCYCQYAKETVPIYPYQNSIGRTNNISWNCEQKEVNDALVWIECKFYTYDSNHLNNVCISLSYNSIAHTPICSGMLSENKPTTTKYVAFTKDQRKQLNDICGIDLRKCKLETSLIQ